MNIKKIGSHKPLFAVAMLIIGLSLVYGIWWNADYYANHVIKVQTVTPTHDHSIAPTATMALSPTALNTCTMTPTPALPTFTQAPVVVTVVLTLVAPTMAPTQAPTLTPSPSTSIFPTPTRTKTPYPEPLEMCPICVGDDNHEKLIPCSFWNENQGWRTCN